MSELLRGENLEKVYRLGSNNVEVFRNLQISIEKGERVAIVGASGVGKSTLLHLMGALDRPTAGCVKFHNEVVSNRDDSGMAWFRNQSIGFIFQFHYLLPEFTALENTALPLWMRGVNKETATSKAKGLLGAVGLGHRLLHRPAELSGGEQQRVAIARALVGEPELLLADEPTGNLDIETSRSVVDLLFSITREGKRSLVIATHNPEIANAVDRILHMREGALFEERKG